jgi:aminoglycoside 6'-N-acetyltransferase
LVTESLGEPQMDQQIASFRARPFGYLQSYPVHAWPAGAPHLADFPTGTMAIDCFVGPSDMIGQGHGSVMVRLYARHLLGKGAPQVVIDPDPENERAVRAYRRAGFRDVALRADGEGDMTLVLRFDPSSLA